MRILTVFPSWPDKTSLKRSVSLEPERPKCCRTARSSCPNSKLSGRKPSLISSHSVKVCFTASNPMEYPPPSSPRRCPQPPDRAVLVGVMPESLLYRIATLPVPAMSTIAEDISRWRTITAESRSTSFDSRRIPDGWPSAAVILDSTLLCSPGLSIPASPIHAYSKTERMGWVVVDTCAFCRARSTAVLRVVIAESRHVPSVLIIVSLQYTQTKSISHTYCTVQPLHDREQHQYGRQPLQRISYRRHQRIEPAFSHVP